MSINTSSDDEQDIERTKQQIRALVAEIAQLSKSDMEAEEFYPAFLQRIVSALVAVGGAIWTVGEGKKLQLAYQINISESLQNSETEESQHHMRLLHSVMARPEGMLAPPLSAHGDAGMGANPTRYLLVLGPLVADGRSARLPPVPHANVRTGGRLAQVEKAAPIQRSPIPLDAGRSILAHGA
jgi:hypothetical protein